MRATSAKSGIFLVWVFCRRPQGSCLISWALGVCKAKFPGPGVLWAIQQSPDVKLAKVRPFVS